MTLTNPVRLHAVHYGLAMARRGVLYRYISGFPRVSPRWNYPDLDPFVEIYDGWQILRFVAGRMPILLGRYTTALESKALCRLDKKSMRPAKESDVFMFASGCGLETVRQLRNSSTLTVCESGTLHLGYVEEVLQAEADRLGLPRSVVSFSAKDRMLREYEESDFVLVGSEFSKQTFVERGHSPDRVIVGHYGVDPPAKFSDKQPNEHGLQVLFVGQLHLRKGVRHLLAAFAELAVPEKSLQVVGGMTRFPGFSPTDVPRGAQLRGVLKGQALADAYASADVLVLPSIDDGFGMVGTEAMYYGTPVIASNQAGVSGIIQQGVNGFVVPAGDAKAIQNRLLELATDRDKLRAMRRSTLNFMRTYPSWEQRGNQLIDRLGALTKP